MAYYLCPNVGMEDFLATHALKILTIGALMVVVAMVAAVRCEPFRGDCTYKVCDGECKCLEWAD